MADYKRGSMDTTEQQKTFAGLMRWTVWVCAITVAVLIFMAIFRT